jgi:hypothetical protein
MSTAELQIQIFQHLKTKLPQDKSVVDELATILDVSTDSAYRRIRGEKLLTIDELHKLAIHFQLSVDQLFGIQSDGFLFAGKFLSHLNFQFDAYLASILFQMKYINTFKEKKIYWLCKDIPPLYHFHSREIAAYKHYVWMKGIVDAPEFARKKFSLRDYPDEFFESGRKSMELYSKINSVEIWNFESINSTIRQIDFYHDMNAFEDENEVILIYEALENLMLHLDRQAALGYKFIAEDGEKVAGGTYEMYLNEIIIGDNSILAVLDGTKAGFIIHTVMNIMMTRDIRFCQNLYESMQNVMRKSTLISSVSERERSRFFKHFHNRIKIKKEKIKASL